MWKTSSSFSASLQLLRLSSLPRAAEGEEESFSSSLGVFFFFFAFNYDRIPKIGSSKELLSLSRVLTHSVLALLLLLLSPSLSSSAFSRDPFLLSRLSFSFSSASCTDLSTRRCPTDLSSRTPSRIFFLPETAFRPISGLTITARDSTAKPWKNFFGRRGRGALAPLETNA